MKIIVDAFGGDNAPLEIIKGCADAVAELDLDIVLTGNESIIRRVAKENAISLNRINIVDAPDVIDMEDSAGRHHEIEIQQLYGCGAQTAGPKEKETPSFPPANSGALVVGATLIVKRIKGIKRVAFAPVMPKNKGFFMLIDSVRQCGVQTGKCFVSSASWPPFMWKKS